MRLTFPGKLCLVVPAAALALFGVSSRAMAAGAPTTTTLAVTAGGSVVSTVSSGTVVTLTATVLSGTTPVTAGQVKFCDATATYCEDAHIVGLAQLTSASTAVVSFRIGVGSHSYKAVFVGTKSDQTSSSAAASLTVLPPSSYASETAIAQSGTPGNYTLTATVGGAGPAPTGTVSFLDISRGNAVLGSAALGATTGFSLVAQSGTVAGTGASQMVVADFNRDGIPDMAVINLGNDSINQISVLLGNGDGTFTAVTTSPAAGEQAYMLVSADFNGDGIPDLAVLNNGGSSIGSVLLGNGDGTFRAIDAGLGPGQGFGDGFSMVVGDFNLDGIPDLAIVFYETGQFTPEGSTAEYGVVSIFLGKGDGTFTQGQFYVMAGGPSREAVVADFNGDGIPDLAVLDGCCGTNILLGKGDGTFTALTTLAPTGTDYGFIVVADFNGDGIPDLAALYPCVTETTCTGTISIFPGNGDGTFSAGASNLAAGLDPEYLVTGDFNGDGIPDLATMNTTCSLNPGQTCSVSVLLGNGDGTFASAAAFVTSNALGEGESLGVGDFNGDGVADFGVVLSPYNQPAPGTALSMLSEPRATTAAVTGVAALPAGSGAHLAVASYSGNGGYTASTSLATTITAAQATPTVTLTASPSPARYGTQVTLTVTVTASGATPTGTVEFYDGATLLNTATLNSRGVASYSSSAFAVGPHSLSASYSGDSNNQGATGVAALTVNTGGTPTIGLTASTNSLTYGSQVIFTATVTAGGVTPTGTVAFLDGVTQLGQGTLNPSGAASLLTTTLAVGQHSIIASYSGDANYNPVTSTAFSVSVAAPITPTITVTPSAGNITPQQGVTVSVAVSGTTGIPTPTGSVTLSGGGYLGQALLAGGKASFRIPAGTLALGSDTLTAAYAGAAPYGPVSGTANVVVGKITPTVAVTPGAGSITTIESLKVTVSVSGGTGAPAATGSVILSSGAYNSAAATLVSGSASITIPAGSLPAGADTLTATYTPDTAGSATYVTAVGTASVTVGKAAVTVTATPSSPTVTTVQAFSVAVSVSGGTGAPVATGTVILGSGAYNSAAATLVSGSASITIPAGSLAAGMDTLTATYTPDTAGSATYAPAAGTALVTVGKAAVTVTATPSSPTVTTVQAFTVAVSVSGGTGAPAATGTVILSSGTFSSSAETLSSGSVTINVPAETLAAGTEALTATYTPDATAAATYNGGLGTATVTVSKAASTTTANPSDASITTAQPVSVTVSVAGGSGNPAPTGSVTLSGGGYNSAATALSSGSATIVIAAGKLSIGADTLSVAYTGDALYLGSNAGATVTVSQAIGTAAATLTVTPSSLFITNQQTDAVAVTVTGTSGQPTGTVTLSSGAYSAQQALAGGAASITIPAGALPAGPDTVTASYSGDPTYAAGAGTAVITVSELVGNAPPPSTVSPGGDATPSVTIAAGSSYSGTLNLVCKLTASPGGAVSLPVCSLNPATLTLSGGGSGTTVVTISTTAGSSASLVRPSRKSLWGLGGGGAVLAVLLLCGIPARRRRLVSMLALVGIAVLSCAIGCGGGGSQTAVNNGPVVPATSAGSYTFTITGTDASNSAVGTSTTVGVTVK